uniref:Uncharacterized protein n=1 Tax=Anguilla anguilla TaxID=7936 RepID=A0A0E9U7B2_ANGAN
MLGIGSMATCHLHPMHSESLLSLLFLLSGFYLTLKTSSINIMQKT